jgi:hypothetical protein
VNRKQLSRMMFPTEHRETWREYVWYCLLFGTVGSAVVSGLVYRGWWHTFFLYVFAVGLCIMGMLLVGWLLYVLLRVVIRNLTSGVS